MFNRPLDICNTIFYGIACCLSSVKPWQGVLFLTAYGFIVNILQIAKFVLYALLIAAVTGVATALFAPIGIILGLIFGIMFLYNLFKNFAPTFAGVCCYFVLLYAPEISHSIFSGLSAGSSEMNIGMFFSGLFFISVIFYIMYRMGYDSPTVSFCVIGLPGYILCLIWAQNNNSDGSSDLT